MRRVAFGILASLLFACGEVAELPPTGQIIFYVDTDAPLPRGPFEPRDDSEPAGLFDRVRVELFAPGEQSPCAGCTRDFALDRATVRAKRASFGFVPRPGADGYRARIRLYRTGGVAGPRSASSIDHYVALPAVAKEGIVEVHHTLSVDDVGRTIGSLDDAKPASPGRPETSKVGTWEGARRVDCKTAPESGEACVPGGAFWMGDLEAEAQEGLVVVSPFVIDATEVTVDAFRAAGVARTGDPGLSLGTSCRYSPSPGPYEDHPVNCVSKDRATAFCRAAGKELPTEAELEYVAGALRSDPFPWGVDQPSCPDAVFARKEGAIDGPYYLQANAAKACQRLGTGTAKVGSGLRDRLGLSGPEIFDLAGNVSEWVRDEGAEGCLARGINRDPACVSSSGVLTVKGGAWSDVAGALRASVRRGVLRTEQQAPELGFRCVKR